MLYTYCSLFFFIPVYRIKEAKGMGRKSFFYFLTCYLTYIHMQYICICFLGGNYRVVGLHLQVQLDLHQLLFAMNMRRVAVIDRFKIQSRSPYDIQGSTYL